MCLYVENKRPRITKSKTTCYKVVKSVTFTSNARYDGVLRGTALSSVRTFTWRLGELEERKVVLYYSEINEGLHAYRTLKNAMRWGSMVVKCVIPKGSKVWFNRSKTELVSNKMIMIGPVSAEEIKKLVN